MKKFIIILSLVGILTLTSAGYAIYNASLKVSGTGNIDSTWDIEVTNIKEESKKGKAISITNPTYTKSTATFNTKLFRSGDNIEYEVELSNSGSIDGKIENITVTNPNNLIKVETRGISKGEVIKAGEIKKYIVRVYIPEETKVTEDVTSKIEVNTEITQDDNQIFNEPIDGVESEKLKIISTVEESNYTSIIASVNAKGKGLKYYYSLDGKTWTSGSTSNMYTFNNLEPSKRYTVYYKVEDENNNYVTESKWINTKEINSPIITVVNENEYETSKEITITYPEIEGATYQYKLGNNAYQTATAIQHITLTENTTVYAKILVSGKEAIAEKKITKIDNGEPTLEITTSNASNSITVVANANAISGISKYEYSIDNGTTWMDNGKYNNYTFRKLTHNKEYTVKVRVTSKTLKTKEMSKTIKTTLINSPTFSESGTSPRTVTITYPSGCGSTYNCSYIKDGGTAVSVNSTTAEVQFTTSGNLIAKVNDGTNYITSSTYTVSMVTMTAPVIDIDPSQTIGYGYNYRGASIEYMDGCGTTYTCSYEISYCSADNCEIQETGTLNSGKKKTFMMTTGYSAVHALIKATISDGTETLTSEKESSELDCETHDQAEYDAGVFSDCDELPL